jgi:phosphoglycerate dehydrogenase-like enzyme
MLLLLLLSAVASALKLAADIIVCKVQLDAECNHLLNEAHIAAMNA